MEDTIYKSLKYEFLKTSNDIILSVYDRSGYSFLIIAILIDLIVSMMFSYWFLLLIIPIYILFRVVNNILIIRKYRAKVVSVICERTIKVVNKDGEDIKEDLKTKKILKLYSNKEINAIENKIKYYEEIIKTVVRIKKENEF